MPTTTIDGHVIHVDDEGFMTEYSEWSEDLAKALAAQIGIDMSDDELKISNSTPNHRMPPKAA